MDDEKQHISNEELSRSWPQSRTTKDLIASLSRGEYFFDAIYQRGSNIWTSQMKSNLIGSIISGVPVGCAHVVEHHNMNDFYLVCDGKQRLETLRDFISNRFGFEWNRTGDMANRKILYFDDLKKPENLDIYRKFMEYSWDLRLWPPMSILKQRDLFDRINAMSNLNTEERLYCVNFFTKVLLVYAHDKLKASIGIRMTNPVRQNKRFTGLKWVHNIMYVLFGSDMRGRNINKNQPTQKTRAESARILNGMIMKNVGEEAIQQNKEDSGLITEEVLKNVGLSDNMQLLVKTSQLLGECLDYHDVGCGKTKMDQNALKDMLVWLCNHLKDATLTGSQVRENRPQFHKLFKKFVDTRKEKGLTEHQSYSKIHRQAMEYLDSLLVESGVNMDKKKQDLTEEQKRLARTNCDGYCPYCNCFLNDENMEYDHLDPKSKSASTIAVCACRICNRKKSDWTSDELRRYAEKIDSLASSERKC